MSQNDDLKFDVTDLADLFGDDVSDVRETVEMAQQMATQAQALSADERAALVSAEAKDAAERTLEEQEALGRLAAERALIEREQEVERQYREMMEAREREFEARTRELEARLAQLQAAAAATASPASEPTTSSDQSPGTIAPPVPPAVDPNAPIDFDAPMPAPFSGASPLVPPVPSVPTFPVVAAVPFSTAPVPDLQQVEDRMRVERDQEYFLLYEEMRGLIALELVSLVGDKKTRTMLSRTMEMARDKYPAALKKADWDMDGNIILDGRLDPQRLQENKDALPRSKADEAMDAALRFLLEVRLKAIEKGLGTGLKNKARARLAQWIAERIEKTRKAGRDPGQLERLRSLLPA